MRGTLPGQSDLPIIFSSRPPVAGVVHNQEAPMIVFLLDEFGEVHECLDLWI